MTKRPQPQKKLLWTVTKASGLYQVNGGLQLERLVDLARLAPETPRAEAVAGL